MEDYRTIQGVSLAEIEEKRSRFIAQAAFAETEQQALDTARSGGVSVEEVRAALAVLTEGE